MKKSNLIYSIIISVIGIIVLLSFFFRSLGEKVHKHTDGETTTMEALENTVVHKEVALNTIQYQAAGIEVGTYSMRNLSEVINANGYTKLPPQNQADVSVYIPGVVKSIYVIEGQYVKKGHVLATIESLAFTQLQQDYLISKSNLEYLTLEYERQKMLTDENVNSKKTYQKTKSDYEIEKARFNALQKQLNTLNLSGLGTPSSTVSIIAPISGYITGIMIKIGSNAEVGKPIFNIVDNTKMHVDLLVYEKDLQKVKPGQNVQFVLTNQNNTTIEGKVFSIGKAFENETKSVAVHADIINDQQILIPGMYVNALINIGTNQVKTLSIDAVIKADGKEFIFILEDENEENHSETQKIKQYHFQRVEIKTGTSQLGYVQVTPLQKIEDHAKIVLKGAYYIQSHLLKSEGGGGHQH